MTHKEIKDKIETLHGKAMSLRQQIGDLSIIAPEEVQELLEEATQNADDCRTNLGAASADYPAV